MPVFFAGSAWQVRRVRGNGGLKIYPAPSLEVGIHVRGTGLEQPGGASHVRPRVLQFPSSVDVFLHQFPAVGELPDIHVQRGGEDQRDDCHGIKINSQARACSRLTTSI